MIIELKDKNYEEYIVNNNNIVFIDFYSDTCPPCQELMPLLERMQDYYKDKNVDICKVNVKENPLLAQKYQIQSIPFCVVIGVDKMVKRAELGLKGEDIYYSMIDNELKENNSLGFLSFFKKFIKN